MSGVLIALTRKGGEWYRNGRGMGANPSEHRLNTLREPYGYIVLL